jgi:hypothetical protein
LELDDSLQDQNIRLHNQPSNYSSLGEIREASLKLATGDVYICWDDDDLYLPWHIEQGMTRKKAWGKPAWMPKLSYYSSDGGKTYTKEQNFMEASVLVDIDLVRRYGFSYSSGLEHLPWRTRIETERKLVIEDVDPSESYAYVWGDKLAPHKTSGDVRNQNNFENHKSGSTDFGERPLRAWDWTRVQWYFNNIERCFPKPTV